MIRRFLRSLVRDPQTVSDRWLRQYAQSQSRVEFHGVCWNWASMKARARRGKLRRVERAA
jgi:hypothetical protein